jgi:hypothetical protein
MVGQIMKIQLLALSVAMGCLLGVPVSAFAQAFNFDGAETRALERYYDGSPSYNGTHTYWDYSGPNSSQLLDQEQPRTVHRHNARW